MRLSIGLTFGILLPLATTATAETTLVGRAILPAETFTTGPTSGRSLKGTDTNGVTVPFKDQQPVQGFSSLVPMEKGRYLALADNGFGKIENSADFELRVYTIHPQFRSVAAPEAGTITVESSITLTDPERKISFPIANQWGPQRILTGADFDLESMVRTPDGTLWIGDEFGPFLLHFSAEGKLLDPPHTTPDVENPGQELRAPENPFFRSNAPLRILQAVRQHARQHGNERDPVFSPNLLMVANSNIEGIRRSGFPVVVWTVNQKEAILGLMELGVDGIISDRPDLLLEAVRAFDANDDGKPGDFLDADGLIDIAKFDAQGHRGGRDLRPESTIPAMEVALDHLMTTLEMDASITSDGIPILSHDPVLNIRSVRRVDGAKYDKSNAVRVKDLTVEQIQRDYIADKVQSSRPHQKNDLDLSPVSVAFAAKKGFVHPYTIPTLEELFAFVPFYVEYYETGAGKEHPEAAQRAKNARRVRFNIETKTDPLPGVLSKTVAPDVFAKAVARAIAAARLEERADIQSFDFRTLRVVQEEFPAIRTVYLFDVTSMDAAMGLAGLTLAPSKLDDRRPPRVASSGGFEGLGMAPDGATLYPMLEKPLIGAEGKNVPILIFDTSKREYGTEAIHYPLDSRATSAAEIVLYAKNRAIVLERDDSQGDLKGFKAVFDVTLPSPASAVEKRLAADLLRIRDPDGISGTASQDVGIGNPFALPFFTIEALVVYDASHIGVMNDNNFPLSVGRHVQAKKPDDSEFVILKIDPPLDESVNSVPNPRPLPLLSK
jgi:glycerophosphoryl diester phosphodiesterase